MSDPQAATMEALSLQSAHMGAVRRQQAANVPFARKSGSGSGQGAQLPPSPLSLYNECVLSTGEQNPLSALFQFNLAEIFGTQRDG